MYNPFDIDSVIEPINQLQSTTSRLEKEEILRQNSDNTSFKEVLKYMLDNLRISGISEKKFDKETHYDYYEEESGDYLIEDLLHYFDGHNTGTDNDIAFVQFYTEKIANTHPDRYDDIYDFVRSIVVKSLRIGVERTTANKIYGKDFIPKLEVMLGSSFENVDIPDNTWFSISQKLNGTRCFYYKGKLYSRAGKEFENLEHIIEDIEQLDKIVDFKQPMVFDGELLLKPSTLSDSEAFQKGTGLANSKEKDKSELRLVLFDIISENDFIEGISKFTYSQRKQELLLVKNIIRDNNLTNIAVVDMFYEGTDQSQIWKYLDYAEEHDMEGLMLNLDTPYECKRTKNLIKVKKFYTMDLPVIRIDRGTGRNKNRLGKVYVEYKGNEVGVGSGFSDEQRGYYWKHSDEIIGKIIEVKYKEKTTNKEGIESLQFPVFISIRNDKQEVSYD